MPAPTPGSWAAGPLLQQWHIDVMVHGAEDEHEAYQEELGKQDPTVGGGPERSHGAHLGPRVRNASKEHNS